MFEDTTTLTLTFTLLISVFLGVLGLIAFLWGLRNGQFDDENRFTHAALFDGEEELNAARDLEEQKKKEGEKASAEREAKTP